ncbi:hypothetical protein QQ054_12050 [Oscillatoria amoena NRMC-F 0135]|nr:hypothetical protein [Oscillatoria amoena NRMC-F 0135]
MKQIIFDSSPYFTALCLLAGLGYASLLYYRTKNPWGANLNRILFAGRTLLVAFICFLLLGPIVKQTDTQTENPVFVILQDNSRSVAEVMDSLTLRSVSALSADLQSTLYERNVEPFLMDLQGNSFTGNSFDAPVTNVHEALRKVLSRFEGRRIAGVVLISDGIYNAGLSPIFGDYPFPVYTVGFGDTTVRSDLAVKDVLYNKIAYQGNKFPLRVEVSATGFRNEPVTIALMHKGSVVERQARTVADDGFIQTEFQPLAAEEGLQRWDVVVERKAGESNPKNNQASVFIDVVKGRKKILLVGAAPHPDIKAIRSVLEKNSNYELLLHVPPVHDVEPGLLQSGVVDLIIFHQVPDVRGRHSDLFRRSWGSKTSLFIILGQQTDMNQLAAYPIPVKYEQPPRQYDEVTPVLHPAFSIFTLSGEAGSVFQEFPPASVHFGKFQVAPQATPVFMQKVGNLVTEKPLMVVESTDQQKLCVMLGEGLWRWRLHEYSKTESAAVFDEFFGKLFQFLCTADDKRKFRFFPVKQEFSETESVVFESQVFNDIFEPVYGKTIDLEITDEQGRRAPYSYLTSPGNTRYTLSGLKEGVYRYRGTTLINDVREEVRGQFLVSGQQLELLTLTADFDLLRKLAANTGGRFYPVSRFDALQQHLGQLEAKGILRSSERYEPVIGIKWIFVLLLLLAGSEWFLRKYYGGY